MVADVVLVVVAFEVVDLTSKPAGDVTLVESGIVVSVTLSGCVVTLSGSDVTLSGCDVTLFM